MLHGLLFSLAWGVISGVETGVGVGVGVDLVPIYHLVLPRAAKPKALVLSGTGDPNPLVHFCEHARNEAPRLAPELAVLCFAGLTRFCRDMGCALPPCLL